MGFLIDTTPATRTLMQHNFNEKWGKRVLWTDPQSAVPRAPL